MDWNNPLIFIVVGLAALGAIWKLGNWMGRQDEFSKTVGKSIETIQSDIKKIFRVLSEGKTIESSSPLRLTDLGKSISKFLDAAAWAERIADEIVENVQDKNPYGIQTYCFELVKKDEFLSEETRKKVEDAAYNNGIEIDKVERVLAIELRDVLLKRLELESPKES